MTQAPPPPEGCFFWAERRPLKEEQRLASQLQPCLSFPPSCCDTFHVRVCVGTGFTVHDVELGGSPEESGSGTAAFPTNTREGEARGS